MYLIDSTYFIQDCYIPNLNEIDSDNLTDLNQKINRDVPKLLREILGVDGFTELNSFISNGELSLTAPQKWIDLVHGVTYDSKSWDGLLNVFGTYKESVLAKYVYYNFLNENVVEHTGVGLKVLSAQNAKDINPTQEIVKAYNNFVKSYSGSNICNASNYDVSLIRFLADKALIYPNSRLVFHGFKNSLGL
ncbi:MAG: hypothetical protein LH615_04085 [Ferruginibacter sp.]|nr:hypothetical protein [Ferruginibacter sp.]